MCQHWLQSTRAKIDFAKDDRKTTWQLLNEAINKRQSNSSLPSSFKSEGKMITDPVEIATKFCTYFTNIGPNLAKAIPDVNSTFRSFLGDDNHPPITLKPTDTQELDSICTHVGLE